MLGRRRRTSGSRSSLRGSVTILKGPGPFQPQRPEPLADDMAVGDVAACAVASAVERDARLTSAVGEP